MAIILGYLGHGFTQRTLTEHVPPGPWPCTIADYVGQYALKARPYRSPSSVDPICVLAANDIPVIANQVLETGSDTGRYRVVKRCDDAACDFIADDRLQAKGPDYHLGFDVFVSYPRRGPCIPVYPPEKDGLVRSLMREMRVREIFTCPL